jgi:hypothetical protein
MRERIFIALALFISLTLITACNRVESKKIRNPSAALVVAGEAKDVTYGTNNGADLVSYNLKVAFPASEVIQEINSKLAQQGYKPLKESFLNPGIPSSMERGWSEYVDATKTPKKTVHQWNNDWSNSAGEIVSHMLRYEYPEGKEKNLTDLKVYAIHMQGALANDMKTQGEVLTRKYKEEVIASRRKGGVSENLKFYLAESSPSKGLTEVTLPSSEKVYIQKTPIITSSEISIVKMKEDAEGYEFRLDLNAEGTRKMHAVTKDNIGKRMAFYYNDEFCSAPIIREAIDSGSLMAFKPKPTLSPSH